MTHITVPLEVSTVFMSKGALLLLSHSWFFSFLIFVFHYGFFNFVCCEGFFFLWAEVSVACRKGDPYFKDLTSWNLLDHCLRIQTSQDYDEAIRARVRVSNAKCTFP